MSYNGWSNYETWNAALWARSDHTVYPRRIERQRYEKWTRDNVKAFFGEVYPDGTPDFDSVMDYCEVDFNEIAQAWNDEELGD